MISHPNRKRASKTVGLVRRRSGFANVSDSFEVITPARQIDDYNESVETYYLPDGYEVAVSKGYTLEIYDADGRHCNIIEHVTGRPQIVGPGRDRPVLKRKVVT